MKIVQITPYAMNRPGGVQSHIRDLSAWLCDQGHEVRIVAPPGNAQIPGLMALGKCRNVSIHGTRFEMAHARREEIRACVEELRDWGAEVAHLHTPWTPMLAWQVWRALGVPSIGTFHATLPKMSVFDPTAWYLRRSAHYFNKRLKAVVVPSDAPLAQWNAAKAKPQPSVMAPAIDLSDWRVAGQNAVESDRLRVVYLGRLEERKGVAVLLEAWKRVHDERPEAELIIAGSGPEEGLLRDQVKHSDIGGVSFQPPPKDDAARELVASADLLVAPALYGESFGLILAEAMAAGTVPIAAANAGFASVLTGPGRELLVTPGESWGLCRKILDFAEHPAKLEQMRRWALSQAQRFDVRTVGPAYETLYRDAI
ncbi:glycosyltransferase family 4 protein [Shimia abyssi]|uniref:Phosphatidylinositol alpha-mannosyltransferase n=1 Tax=Shimia abyssi TaxID=1662395 RepID=A0A2P8FAK2_9RHOB|nr:glycosyltransferase family 4 protein [Shimia abyssi]PSL18734.1 phosphatidylinositol alpha-mannosyltransferase [Shimia abyssi]